MLPESVIAQSALTIQQKHYEIPAGELGSVLAQFSQAADISLSYDPLIVRDQTSAGLSGSYTVATGFARLLDGSGLTAVLQEGGYVLRATLTLPNAMTTTTLPSVAVRGRVPVEDYTAAASNLATGVATPLQQLPQSVQVMTKDLIRDQQPQSLLDIVRNAGGVDNNASMYGYGMDAYEMRGFGTSLRVDDIPMIYLFNIPSVALERVEVLKGADAALASDAAPGGIISVTTKQPQRTRVREATLQAGSFGEVQAALDIGGAFPTNNNLLYRVVISNETANRNYGGYRDMRQFYIAPSVAWDDGKTRLVFGVQYTRGRNPQWPYTIAMNGRPVDLKGPIDNEDQHTDFDWGRVYYQYQHKLDTNWSIRSNVAFSRQTGKEAAYSLYSPESLGDFSLHNAGDIYYQPYEQRFTQRNIDIDNSLAGKIVSGSVTHKLVFGLAYSQLHAERKSRQANYASLYNIFERQVPYPSPVDDVRNETAGDTFRNWRAYIQDYMSIGARWHVMTALSFHKLSENNYSEQKWMPKLGASYDLSDQVSLYGHYSRSSMLQQAFLEDGSFAPPSSGKVLEGGIKISWPDKPLDLSVALFRASQDNIVLSTGVADFHRVVPSDTARGIEFSLQGELSTGWKVLAGYTYTDYNPPTGQVNQTPRNTVNLWTTYRFQNAELHNWGIGAGIYARSSYTGYGADGLGDFTVPGQARTDFSLFYKRERFSATLGVKNAFDRPLYAGNAIATQVFRQAGRSVFLTTTYQF